MRLFIGCSSSEEIPSDYTNGCKDLFEILFSRDNDLVFGANNTGLMGLAHDCALKYGRRIIGVCPEIYKDDFKKLKCDKEIVAKTVGERTEKAVHESDILIFVPGGFGTLYELITAIEIKREHEHDKPIIIFNYNNYYNELLLMFEKFYKEKFNSLEIKKLYLILNSADEVINYLANIENEKECE